MNWNVCPLLLLATQLLVACGPERDEAQHPPGDETDPLGQHEQAASFSCTSSSVSLVQPNGAVRVIYDSRPRDGDIMGRSDDATYDQALCPHNFVTEVQQVKGREFYAFVEAVPASSNITESACRAIAITGSAWGFKGTGWTPLGDLTTAGVWHPATCNSLCFPAYCQLRFTIAYRSSGNGFSKVRVAGNAAVFGVFKTRVQTGLSVAPIIW
jgi:hypothetical protein